MGTAESQPSLIPLTGTDTAPLLIRQTPFWIGSAGADNLRLFFPGVSERHAAVLEREDGFWMSRGRGAVSVDDQPVGADGVPLRDGSVIELVPGCRYAFASGAAGKLAELEER